MQGKGKVVACCGRGERHSWGDGLQRKWRNQHTEEEQRRRWAEKRGGGRDGVEEGVDKVITEEEDEGGGAVAANVRGAPALV